MAITILYLIFLHCDKFCIFGYMNKHDVIIIKTATPTHLLLWYLIRPTSEQYILYEKKNNFFHFAIFVSRHEMSKWNIPNKSVQLRILHSDI